MPLSFGPRSKNGSPRCSASFRPTSAGVGKADFAPTAAGAPTSLAYSESAAAAPPFGSVARCQAPTATARNSSESTPASSRSLISRPLDREAVDVLLRLHRVEGAAHYAEALGGRLRRGEADLGHQPRGVGGQEHLARYLLVVDLALQLAPALHLREDPDGEGMPWKGVEVDAVRDLAHVAQAIGEGAGQHLLHYRDRLVQVVRRRDGGSDFLAVLELTGVGSGGDDALQQRVIGVRHAGDELLRR